MGDFSKNNKLTWIDFLLWLAVDLLPGLGLIVFGLITASYLPADAVAMGSFLCFFVMGVTYTVESTRKRLRHTSKKDGDREA